jgi:hypothetical protein
MAKRLAIAEEAVNGEEKGKPGPKKPDSFTAKDIEKLWNGLQKRMEKLQLIVAGMNTHNIPAIKLGNRAQIDELMSGLRELCENGRDELNADVPAGQRPWDDMDY